MDVHYFAVEVELLHVLIRVADADESAELRGGFGFCGRGPVGGGFALDGLAPPPPPVAVRLLGHFGVQDDHDHVAVLLQVAHHRLTGQPLLLGSAPVRRSGRPI
jgi:hypothetical protein